MALQTTTSFSGSCFELGMELEVVLGGKARKCVSLVLFPSFKSHINSMVCLLLWEGHLDSRYSADTELEHNFCLCIHIIFQEIDGSKWKP